MHTGRFLLFFFPFYASDMGDVKALISQMFGVEEMATVCSFLGEKYWVFRLSNLVLDPDQDSSKSI